MPFSDGALYTSLLLGSNGAKILGALRIPAMSLMKALLYDGSVLAAVMRIYGDQQRVIRCSVKGKIADHAGDKCLWTERLARAVCSLL